MMATVPTLHVIAVGSFGAGVAGQISRTRPGTPVAHTDHDLLAPTSPDHRLPPAGAYLLAAGRPVPGLAALVEQAAFERAVPWLPVTVEHPLLRIGPAVVPGVSACYQCWRRRLRQHAVSPDLDSAVERTYRHATADLPAGHLPATAHLAGVMALDMLDGLARLGPGADHEAGRVRQMDLLTRRVSDGRAVGVHGCPRCGLGGDERDRSHRLLRAELSEVLG